MQIGLFTADNIILQTLLFFMTYSVVYSIVVTLYEDVIIREDNISVGLVVIAVKTIIECTSEIVLTFMILPSAINYWSTSEEGHKDCNEFFGGILLIVVGGIVIVGVVGGLFFGINYLLVDSGAGHYCKVWNI